MQLNKALLIKQNISKQSEIELELLYSDLSHVLAHPEEYEDPVKYIEEVELSMQKLWKFPQDTRYHRYWKAIKGCACPYTDNEDPMFFGRRIINQQCQWHNTKGD